MGDHASLLDSLYSLYKYGIRVNKVGLLRPLYRQFYSCVVIGI